MDVSTIKDFIFDIEIYPLVNVNPTPSPRAYYLGISNVFSPFVEELAYCLQIKLWQIPTYGVGVYIDWCINL